MFTLKIAVTVLSLANHAPMEFQHQDKFETEALCKAAAARDTAQLMAYLNTDPDLTGRDMKVEVFCSENK